MSNYNSFAPLSYDIDDKVVFKNENNIKSIT